MINALKNKKHHNKLARKEWIDAYLFLLPAAIFFFWFVILQMIGGAIMSFFDYNPKTSEFIGLQNIPKII